MLFVIGYISKIIILQRFIIKYNIYIKYYYLYIDNIKYS